VPEARGAGQEAVRKATVDVDVNVAYEAFRLAEDTPLVQALRAAIAAGGGAPRCVTGQGGSDANILNSRGLPAAVLGCGMHGAHSVRERASLGEMGMTVETLLRLLEQHRPEA
jgi:tripeptide aminopeptidase